MSNDDLDLRYFRQLLEASRAELTEIDRSAREAADPVQLDQTRQGRLSRMDALQQQAMASESNRRRTLELNRIDAALKRITAEEFGDCGRCGEPIAIGRLEADPTATLCLDCAEAAERD
jgi:DnaK suppressor protein